MSHRHADEAAATVWYFAYGSNMQSATLRGRRGIEFRRALPGRLRGWRLVFDKPPLIPVGGSYANIVRDRGAEVLGVLYEVSTDELRHIDLTEGVLIGNYHRFKVVVESLTASHDGMQTAFTLASEQRDPTLLPSTRYMDLLIAGAIEHGLPAEYVAFLRTRPSQPESAVMAALRPFFDEALRRR